MDFYRSSVVFRLAEAKNDRQKKESTVLPQATTALAVSIISLDHPALGGAQEPIPDRQPNAGALDPAHQDALHPASIKLAHAGEDAPPDLAHVVA